MAGPNKGVSELSNRIKCREFLGYRRETTGFSTDIALCGVRSQNYEQMSLFLRFDVADYDAGNDVITVEAQIAGTT